METLGFPLFCGFTAETGAGFVFSVLTSVFSVLTSVFSVLTLVVRNAFPRLRKRGVTACRGRFFVCRRLIFPKNEGAEGWVMPLAFSLLHRMGHAAGCRRFSCSPMRGNALKLAVFQLWLAAAAGCLDFMSSLCGRLALSFRFGGQKLVRFTVKSSRPI